MASGHLVGIVPLGPRFPGCGLSLDCAWELLNGRPLFVWAADALGRLPGLPALLAVPAHDHSAAALALQSARLSRVSLVEGAPSLGALLLRVFFGDPGSPADADRRPGVAAGPPQRVVVHDPLCPLLPVETLSRACRTSLRPDELLCGVRPVTDTVKVVHGGLVSGTLDREALLLAASPLVISRGLAREASDAMRRAGSLPELVSVLRDAGARPRWLRVPAVATRVDSRGALAVLEGMAGVEDPADQQPS